jgi:hypothetical protein
MKTWESGGIAPPFLISALDGREWSPSSPGRFNPGEGPPRIHWIGGWMGPGAGLDDVDKRKIFAPAENRNPAIHPVARRYTNWVISSAHKYKNNEKAVAYRHTKQALKGRYRMGGLGVDGKMIIL